jgi:hypothetical protein
MSLLFYAGGAYIMGHLPIFSGWTFWQCVGAQFLVKHVLSSARAEVTVVPAK